MTKKERARRIAMIIQAYEAGIISREQGIEEINNLPNIKE